MLTLTRKVGERIKIGDDIVVEVREICGKQVRIGIVAPRNLTVFREELVSTGGTSALETRRNAAAAMVQDAKVLVALDKADTELEAVLRSPR